MRFIKKNQVVVFVIGLMLVTAGYLNFTNTNNLVETGALTDAEKMASIGDAKLVSTTPVENNNVNTNEAASENGNIGASVSEKLNSNEILNNSGEIEEDKENVEDKQTNAQMTVDEYFTKSRLERDTMYSQMIESYQKILDKTTISETQKESTRKEITKINEQKNAIMITENLIKTKGFEDLIIFVNDKSINVIVKAKELKTEQIAQIQNIITRELKADITNIHITNK